MGNVNKKDIIRELQFIEQQGTKDERWSNLLKLAIKDIEENLVDKNK